MQPTLEFVIEGEPVQWKRPAQFGRTRFTPEKQRKHMETVAWHGKIALGNKPLLTRAIHLRCQFVYEWPKTWDAKKRGVAGAHLKKSVPDASNLLKQIEDALNGVVWRDDAQVYWAEAIKIWGTHDHTRIWIEEWPE